MKRLPATIRDYVRLIETRTHFAQANYGDGEWECILGREGQNANGERYEPELAEALLRTLTEPAGQWCGLNPGRKLRAEVEAFIRDRGIEAPWVYKEIISTANAMGDWAPFLGAIRRRRLAVVGPAHLEGVAGVLGLYHHHRVRDASAWQEAEPLVASLRRMVDVGEVDLVLFCAGMGSNLMIHRLWPLVEGRATLLDVGACLDPYAGVFSRRHYRRPSFVGMMRRNLEEPVDWIEELMLGWMPGDTVPTSEAVVGWLKSKHDVAARLRPRVIVETGVRAGYSAFAMLSAVPEARYVGIDDDSCRHGGFPGALDHARALLQRFPAADIVVEDSKAADPAQLAALGVDLFHIDADHSTEGCTADLDLAEAAGARWILVDDTDNIEEVRDAVEAWLAERRGYGVEWIHDGHRGSALIDLTGASSQEEVGP